MKPTGYTHLTGDEIRDIKLLRFQNYSVRQISEMTGRSASTIKRITLDWPKQNKR